MVIKVLDINDEDDVGEGVQEEVVVEVADNEGRRWGRLLVTPQDSDADR